MAAWNKNGLSRLVKISHSMTRIYSYTLKLSAFLLRRRVGTRFCGHWISRGFYGKLEHILKFSCGDYQKKNTRLEFYTSHVRDTDVCRHNGGLRIKSPHGTILYRIITPYGTILWYYFREVSGVPLIEYPWYRETLISRMIGRLIVVEFGDTVDQRNKKK